MKNIEKIKFIKIDKKVREVYEIFIKNDKKR